MLKSQKEILEFTFRFRLVADSLSALERQVSLDLSQFVERGVAPGDIGVTPGDMDRIIAILGLTHQELARAEHELESCRTLNEQALMSLECDRATSAPQEPLNDGLGPK